VVGGAAKAVARQPYRRRVERGRAVTAVRRSDTARLSGDMRGEAETVRAAAARGRAVTSGAVKDGARPGSDGGVACSDTHGRERGAALDRLSGRAAGQRFMAQAHAWQRCRGSRRELETEHQRVGPHAESGDRQVGPWVELFLT
jgi:hypothetical protein